MIITNPIWTCLLIPLKYMENQEHSGQVQFRFMIITKIEESFLLLTSFICSFSGLITKLIYGNYQMNH
jgi:hypothetical protein